MSKRDDGGPAFPTDGKTQTPGLTWLDHAAIEIAAVLRSQLINRDDWCCDDVAEMAYEQAEAMLAEKRRMERGDG